MSQLTIRNISDEQLVFLKQLAQEKNQSREALLRALIDDLFQKKKTETREIQFEKIVKEVAEVVAKNTQTFERLLNFLGDENGN